MLLVLHYVLWGALGVVLYEADLTWKKPLYWVILAIVLGTNYTAQAIITK